MTKAECEQAVAEGKLGIKYCNINNDYWAGAVKQCGGISEMPTPAQLAELGSQLYIGNPNIEITEYKNYIQYNSNSSAAKALGLTPGFYIWSGEESSRHGAYFRNFYPTNSYLFNDQRGASNIFAICTVK